MGEELTPPRNASGEARDLSYVVIVRGPLGVGKSTVTRRLALQLGAQSISIDVILDELPSLRWEDGYISQRDFIEANRWGARLCRTAPELRNAGHL